MLHEHTVGYQLVCDRSHFLHHHGEKKLFFLSVVVLIRIVSDKVNQSSKVFVGNFRPVHKL